MIVKVVVPDSIYAKVFFARGEQGPQGVQGEVGPIGPQGPQGIQGVSYTPGDPIYVTVTNKTGNSMAKGTIVYTSGGNGTHTQVSPALASGDLTSARTLGWLSQTLDNNQTGLCMVEGYLDGINTQGITDGSQLYLSPTVPGGFTATKPSAPEHMVYVGVSVKASAGDGRVYVKVQNGYELDELHDVAISAPVDNQVLTYESSTGLWKNKANPADGVTSITATSPLTGGTITSTGSIGLNQSLLTLAQSQITNLVTDLGAKASTTDLTSGLALKANLAGGNAFTGAQTITGTVASSNVLTLTGASGQTGFLLSAPGGARIPAAGNYFIAPGITSTFTADFNAGSATTIAAVVRGASGQTADLTQWQNSGGTVLGAVTSGGTFYNIGNIATGTSTALGRLTSLVVTPTVVGAVIRGAASQTANLQEWQNSAGTVLARITSAGVLRASQVLSLNGLSSMGEFNNGAIFEFVRATGASYSPGANRATLYFRDGTNAGTLKLVVRAGAAGAETTILDNIPQ